MESNNNIGLLELKRDALMMGLCDEYKDKWDKCSTKRDLVKMALDSNGIEFMADSIAFGWGMSKEYLLKEFGEFMNGLFICDEGGYTSEMFVGAHGVVKSRSTLMLVAYCDDLEIIVPENTFCRIYVCGGSKVYMNSFGVAYLVVYGSNNHITRAHMDGVVTRKDITESQWLDRKSYTGGK